MWLSIWSVAAREVGGSAVWTLIVAAASPIVVVLGFWYTQRQTDRREIAKWRNDQLLATVSELLRLSTQRQSELLDAYDAYIYHYDGVRRGGKSSEKVWKMELLVEEVRLLDRRCADAAEEIYKGHKAAQFRAATEFRGDFQPPDDEYAALMVDDLADLHIALVDAFQAVTRVVEPSGGALKPRWWRIPRIGRLVMFSVT